MDLFASNQKANKLNKVVFLIDTLQTGGAEKSLLDITSRFRKYKPVFIQLFKGDELKPLFEAQQIQVLSMNLSPSYKFKAIAKHILPYIEELQPELLHSTLFRSDMVSRELQKMTGLPLINSFVNNSYSKSRYKKMSLLMMSKLFCIQQWDKLTARKVDLFISNSKAIKQSNTAALAVNKKRVKVIYRGRDSEVFQKVNQDAVLNLRKHFEAHEKTVFLNVSRLLSRKGQLDLVKSFKSVVDRYPEVLLLIAGEGPYRAALEQEISRLGLQRCVKLLGNRGDISDLLHFADYFVFPSHYEGLPGALIEAMFAGTPIIASSIPENMECVNEEMAYLYNPGDITQLERKLCEALSDKAWPDRIQHARQYAMANFEINSIASQYEETYTELLNNA